MAATARQQPAWQSHKHTESIDSEVSYFDPSTSSSAGDTWSGYFEGWNGKSRDSYCPHIASASSSPTRSQNSDETPTFEPELLPSACPRQSRPQSIRRDAEVEQPTKAARRSKRYGIVPYADPQTGKEAVARLDSLLQNNMSNTEDILAAMYSSDWDAASLQDWYEQSPRGPSDLALFKIMFSLRYTIDEPSPIPT